MRNVYDINSPFSFKISQNKRVVTWHVGKRKGTEPLRSTKPSVIAAQVRDIAVRFNPSTITF